MARKSIIENLFDNYGNYIEKVLITILNSFLIVILLNNLNYQSYDEIVVPIVAIISAVIPEIMAPIMTLLFAIDKLYSLYDAITPLNILDGFFIIVLGIIIPIVLEIRYHSLQAFISAESAIATPFTSYFLLAGISEKRSSLVNILSALPLFYLVINIISQNLVFNMNKIEIILIGVVGIIVGAYLFGIKKVFSLLGLIPSIIGVYALYYNTVDLSITNTIIYISIIAIIIASISILFTALRETKAKSEKRNEQINLINKEIDETLLALGRIKSYAELEEKLGSVLIEDENSLAEISKSLEKCGNFDCIKKVYEDFKDKRSKIEDKINNLFFALVVDYNNVVTEIKKAGITLDEIQIPKDKIKLTEDNIDFIQKTLLEINKNTVYALNQINSIIEALEKLNGIKLNKYYVTDYSLLPKAVGELQKEDILSSIKEIINLDREIISNLQMIGYEKQKIEYSKKINDSYGRNLVISEIPNIQKVTSSLVDLIVEYMETCTNKLEKINESVKIPSINDYVKISKEIKKELSEENKSLKQKLTYLITFIPNISNIESIISDESAINALFSILKDNEEVIKNKIYEEECIKIEDLGINDKFAKYVIEYFSRQNLKLIINQDKICITK